MEHPLVWSCTDFIGVSIIFGPNCIGRSRPCATSIDGRAHLHRIWGANALCEFCTQCLGCETQNETWGKTFLLLALISWTVFNPPKQSKHTSKSKPIVGLNLWLQAKNSNRWAANFGVLEIGPHAYIVPNPYQRFMVISTEESKTANYKFTSRAKATSLSKKLDILRKERNVTCPSKETTKTSLFSCWVQEFGPTSTIKCLKLKTPIFQSAFIAKMTHFHSTVFFVFPSILRSRCCMELKQLHWIGRHSEGCCFAWIKETTNGTLKGVPLTMPYS